MAMALRAGTTAVNDPLVTTNLAKHLSPVHTLMSITHVDPEHCPPELEPVMTSQYEPEGRDVLNVASQLVSALFIAINPNAPVG